MDEGTFDATVAGFFRAATGALSWDDALVPVQRAFGARAAVLQTFQPSTGRLLALRTAGPDLAACALDFVREWHLADPRRHLVLERGEGGLGQWLHDSDHFGDAFMARSRYYRHFLAGYGMRYHGNVVFMLERDLFCGLALELADDRGPLSADERELARRLGIYIEEALHAHERMRRIAAQALAGHRLLSAFAYPMWLIDSERCIGFENTAATAERQRDHGVAVHGQRLVLASNRAERAFTLELQRLAAAGHGARGLVDLRRSSADPPLWLHLSVLVPGQTLGAFGEQPQLLATLFDPAQQVALDPFALAQVFALSPTEAKVAVLLAAGRSVQEIAAEQRTALSTVRTHVRHLLDKFGTRRMTDVVRVLQQGQALWAGAPRP